MGSSPLLVWEHCFKRRKKGKTSGRELAESLKKRESTSVGVLSIKDAAICWVFTVTCFSEEQHQARF